MHFRKKLVKFGGSYVVVIPSDFIKRMISKDMELYMEMKIKENGQPKLTLEPVESELDNLESDPRFTLFMQALYENAMRHPEQLKTDEEVWGRIDEMLENVPLSENDEDEE